ncbi:hypothetical protein GFS31_16650 [Leptolyngbya sp. BL0902]|uniref:hypothetical protein n=1 Tax=Leptolyngbya sp. BL0902 TaxID=1115757 RepID=UPI0018E75AA2|nr:hypothetical protein [Leptolyngbya sp. BL0902]QQE64980.1 hypothetical protein GFS31_16650 [Leptolyngbya sp. BL0902]
MDKIKEQANVVGQLVFSGETGEIYKKMLTRTWEILRATGLLLWLVICLTFVGGEWFYRNSISLGSRTRVWYTNFSTKSADAEPLSMETTGAALLDTIKSGSAYLLSQARQQLGLPASTPAASAPKAAPVAPAAAPVAPSAPAVSSAPAPATSPAPTMDAPATPVVEPPTQANPMAMPTSPSPVDEDDF